MAAPLPIQMDASTVLHGSGHVDAVAGVGITRGVDEQAFEAFIGKNARMDAMARGMIFELPGDPQALQPASCDSAPLVRTVRCRTVANTLLTGSDVRRWARQALRPRSQCPARKS